MMAVHDGGVCGPQPMLTLIVERGTAEGVVQLMMETVKQQRAAAADVLQRPQPLGMGR